MNLDDTGIVSDEIPEAPGSVADLTKEAAELKLAIDDLEAQAKVKGERFAAVKEELLRALDLAELDNVRAHGFLFFREHRTTVSTPKTPEAKAEFFDFLTREGIFLEIASVNSQTLNSLFKTFSEKAAKDGNLDYRMPGIAEPQNNINLKMRRG